ncbi:Band 7 protein OS=Sphingobacterium sp. PM2-P1-29 GN=BN1088_1430293 PE=4 SV=1 [Gemmata massiliana]|uniref:Band 7 protein n=1 Tax=Gemmata massiliana TaxID=1210884 RepID=A0A6P2CWL0_9BACT|nr:hypothetical protein [Gemmata massiliana]VTR93528.1 Band 7 protein OS=Sphingobacterium sp. PM2-P1-29 GN=BN1088_1430293 PE=4 SV=1 [Gemmata massiliana]
MDFEIFIQSNPVVVGLMIAAIVVTVAALLVIVLCHRKVEQGFAIIRSGYGGTKVAFDGLLVLPIVHRVEYIDISVKKIEISRCEGAGVLCKDNMRADIRANFILRINKTVEDVLLVARTVGCQRASSVAEIRAIFDSKFSDSIKTIVKRYDFASLHDHRDQLKDAIAEMTGRNLNGYVLVDCSIDYLEQTSKEHLNPESVLDAEGIKKIAELTAAQIKEANRIENEKALAIKKQDADREKEVAHQDEEVKQYKATQAAETARVEDEQRKTQELIKVKNDLELAIERERAGQQKAAEKIAGDKVVQASQIALDRERDQAEIESEKQKELAAKDKERLILEKLRAIEIEKVENEKQKELAAKDKERLILERQRAIEIEKVESEKQKELAVKDKERQVLERQRAIEIEKVENEKQKELAAKDKERLILERQRAIEIEKVESEKQKELATKDKEQMILEKQKIIENERRAIAEVQQRQKDYESAAESDRDSRVAIKEAETLARQKIIESETAEAAAGHEAAAIRQLATAKADDAAAIGIGEARVHKEKQLAEAEGYVAKAAADAKGIREKADAMKQFDEVGRAHEEFKLRLEFDRVLALAQLETKQRLAEGQASVLGEALKHANINLVGGEGQFIDRVLSLVGHGKAIDAMVGSSSVLNHVKDAVLGIAPGAPAAAVKELVARYGLDTGEFSGMTLSAAIGKLLVDVKDAAAAVALSEFLAAAVKTGLASCRIDNLTSRIS